MELEVDTMTQAGNTKNLKSVESLDSESLELKNLLKVENEVNLGDLNRKYVDDVPPLGCATEFKAKESNLQEFETKLEPYNDLNTKNDQNLENLANLANEVGKVLIEDKSEEKEEDDELPEGWVRCGKGLKVEFPNIPRDASEKSLESKNLFINFTNKQNPQKSQSTLQNTLMNLDRSAVKELKGGLVAIKASNPQSSKLGLNSEDHYPSNNVHTMNRRRCNTATTRPKYSNFVNPERNNTFSCHFDKEVESLKARHQNELEQTKQSLLAKVEDLVKKYRELAVDAVNAARNEQKKCQEQCQQAYATAYNACLKYENDLKNTVKFALKEYQHSINDNQHTVATDKAEFLKKYNDSYNGAKDVRVVSHKLLREDLSYDYQVDEKLLSNFEPKVLEKFDSLVHQLSLYLQENYNFSHNDSREFVKSVISSSFP